jgi:malate dehydrogenase (quinone)
MSVLHLDKRVVDGTPYLLFGPYASFSTKLLKHGRWTDFFTTMRWHNLHVITAALIQNVVLIRYLITQLARPRRKFTQLQRYYPPSPILANGNSWRLVNVRN